MLCAAATRGPLEDRSGQPFRLSSPLQRARCRPPRSPSCSGFLFLLLWPWICAVGEWVSTQPIGGLSKMPACMTLVHVKNRPLFPEALSVPWAQPGSCGNW